MHRGRIAAGSLGVFLSIILAANASAQSTTPSTAPGSHDRPSIKRTDVGGEFIPVADSERVVRSEGWAQGGGGKDGGSRNRYYWPLHVRTKTPGATLTLDFQGHGVAAVFHTPRVRAYGSTWKNGGIRTRVDDAAPVDFIHDQEALEVVLADGLKPGPHRLVFEHLENGCTLMGFRVFHRSVGHIEGVIKSEHPDYLFDVRLSVWRGDQLIRTGLHRNWLSQRFRITGLPPGNDYQLSAEAIGWTGQVQSGVAVEEGKTTKLAEIKLKASPSAKRSSIEWPALGYQAIRCPSEVVAVQVADGNWRQARLIRPVGESHISRIAPITQDESGRPTFTVPSDTPPGVYDLELLTSDAANPPTRSPRSVVVRAKHAAGDVRILTWGHTDTWGQLQGEFECALAQVANTVGPDLVLVSNSVNPAVIAGAMSRLEAPYLINFGNHRLRGHEQWYGDQVGLVDLGPEFAVFNFGPLWKEDTTELETLMRSRKAAPGKILNTLESDVPRDLLVRHDIRLMHDAHGWLKPKVLQLPETPTMRVGKQTASSFRFVTMKKYRVTDVSEPLEVPRVINPQTAWTPDPPLRVEHQPSPNKHTHRAVIINDLPRAVPQARVVFLVRPGQWRAEGGAIESQSVTDDKQWQEIIVRADAPERSSIVCGLHIVGGER